MQKAKEKRQTGRDWAGDKGQKAARDGHYATLKGKVLPPVVKEQKPTGVPLFLAGNLLWSTSL